MTVWPRATACANISPVASGDRSTLSTVMLNVCVASRSPGSRATTVTVAVPGPTPVTVTSLPPTETERVFWSEVVALYVSESPSGSLKLEETFTWIASPSSMVDRGGTICPTVSGARLLCTVTPNS